MLSPLPDENIFQLLLFTSFLNKTFAWTPKVMKQEVKLSMKLYVIFIISLQIQKTMFFFLYVLDIKIYWYAVQ